MRKLKTMMMTLMMCLTSLVYSQIDSLHISPVGMSNNKQTFLISKSKNELLSKSKEWVNKMYVNPDKVVSGFNTDKQLNDHFVITGYSESVYHYQNYNKKYYVNVKYEMKVSIKDSNVNIEYNILEMYSPECVLLNSHTMCDIQFSGLLGFYSKKGKLKSDYWDKTNAINDLENFVNNLVFSFYNQINSNKFTSDEALSELKKCKDKLDLGLITQEEFNEKKQELSKYIIK